MNEVFLDQSGVLDSILSESNLNVSQIFSVEEDTILNSCLILTQQAYADETFQNRSDFRFVVAISLLKVSRLLFHNCHSLQLVFMPRVHTISNGYWTEQQHFGAFSGTSLKSFSFPQLKVVGDCAFGGCPLGKLQNQMLPRCEELGRFAFCSSHIQFVELQNAIKINNGTFQECQSLKTIVIQKLEQVPENAFKNCQVLTTAEIPLLKAIMKSGFENCGFKSLKFPKLEQIEALSLANCRNLQFASFPILKKLGSLSISQDARLQILQIPKAWVVHLDGCSGLQVIRCPESASFRCKGCAYGNWCPVCSKLLRGCVRRGEVLGRFEEENKKLEKGFESFEKIGAGFRLTIRCQYLMIWNIQGQLESLCELDRQIVCAMEEKALQ